MAGNYVGGGVGPVRVLCVDAEARNHQAIVMEYFFILRQRVE